MAQHEQAELEDLMNLWQSNAQWTAPLRENFEQQKRKDALWFYFGMAFMLAILIGMICLVTGPNPKNPTWFFYSAIALDLFAMGHTCWAHFNKKIGTPLTPQEYLDKARHNLNIEQKTIWMGKFILWPCALLILFIALYLIYNKAPLERFLLIALGLAAPGYTLTWYVIFIYSPRKLQKELRRLESIDRDWSVD